jgi:mono/diheme cytochrome c family protein
MKRIFLATVALIGLASHAGAQTPGDPQKGAALANSVCAQCHAVRKGQLRSPDPMAPSFSTVAKAPGMTDRALRVWLQSSHPTMPNFILSGDEKNDVIAYILSLQTGHSGI